MTCSNCQHTNPSDANFCNNCGNKLALVCPKCQTENPKGSKFCKHCGNSLQIPINSFQSADIVVKVDDALTPINIGASSLVTPKAAERRQLTCLFCDLVGSTALSEQLDAEEYRQVILDYQQVAEKVIKQHGGHIAQYLGDGLLVYFGYPKGLEDAPKAGVQAGLGILDAVAKANEEVGDTLKVSPTLSESTFTVPIDIRIGIHTGLVVVDDHLALGDTVNIAARLEGLAPVNGLVISPQTLKLVQGWFEVKNLGKEVLKGIKEPMEIFQVIKESGANSRIEIAKSRGLSPLVGREEEVSILLRNWKQAKRGKGQLLLLNGEAGIGKSRLVEHLKGQVRQEENVAKLELRCSDYHLNSSFYPLLDLLEKRILGFEKDETAESKIVKLQAWMEFAGIDKKPNLPIFADFLSIPIRDEIREQYENPLIVPAGKRKKFMEGFSTALFNFSQQQPIILIVEDLHWMDSSTLEWLNQLVEHINTYPLFILATTRPQFQPTWANKSYIGQVNLHRLNTDKIEAICLHQTQGKSLPKAILLQIKEKTDGVPLFVEEMTRMIIESDWLIEQKTHYELKGDLKKLPIPTTLQDSLIARLDRLSTGKELAQIGAVLGREFSFEILQAITNKPPGNLAEDLSKLVKAEFLYQKGIMPKSVYIFKHALIQDTAYESLLKKSRKQLHQTIAEVLASRFKELMGNQPELLAHHLTEAGLYEKALLKWEEAGNRAVSDYANNDAVHHFEKALSLLQYLPNEIKKEAKELDLLSPYNIALSVSKGWFYPDVEKNAKRVIQLSEKLEDYQKAFLAYYGLNMGALSQGNHHTALIYIQKAISLSKKIKDLDFLPQCYASLGENHFLLGNLKESIKYSTLAIQEYDEQKHEFLNQSSTGNVKIRASTNLARVLSHLGYPSQAKKLTIELQQSALQHKNIITLFQGYMYPASILGELRDWTKAKEALFPLLSIIEETGAVFIPTMTKVCYFCFSAAEGSSKDLENAKHLMNQMQAFQLLYYQPSLYSILVEAYLNFNNFKDGMDCVEKALAMIQKTHEKIWLPYLLSLKGKLLILEVNKSPSTSKKASNEISIKAEQLFLEAIKIAKEHSNKLYELRATTELASLWHSQGKTKEAYELLNEIYSWFTEGFDTIDLQEAKVLLAALKPK